MTLAFTIERKPVSVNRAYIRAGFGKRRGAGGGKGLILSQEARDFKAAVYARAVVTRGFHGEWPAPDRVRAVALSITTWNTRHDADAAIKLLQDALEGALYTSDRVVRSVHAARDRDGGKPRIDVELTLLETI